MEGDSCNAFPAATSTIALDPTELVRLRARLRVEGAEAIARRSGASVPAVTRAGSGLPIRPGTRALLLASLETSSEPPPPDPPEAA